MRAHARPTTAVALGLSGLCLGLALAGCSTAPVADLRSNADVRSLNEGQRRMWYAAEQLEDSIRKRNLVYENAELTSYAQSVLDRLYPEFKGTLQVRLLDSPHLNAFCLPNGHIYFNTGLLVRLDNEAQLATVLAHEGAHFIHQHSLKQRNSVDGTVLVGTGLEILTGIPLSGTLLTATVLSSYSQSHENEADEEGFARLVQSGYDPHHAPRTFQKLLDEVDALDIDEPFLFSSHPKLKDRIASFNRLIEKVTDGGGTVNAEEFLRLTRELRRQTLARYLEMNNHKVLLLILENDKLRDRYTRHPEYYFGEAYLLRNDDGDANRAVDAFENSIEADASFAPAYRALGQLLMRRGEKGEAIDRLSTYLSLEPDAPDREYVEIYLKQLGM
jgi:predicted Zn-dependent protease